MKLYVADIHRENPFSRHMVPTSVTVRFISHYQIEDWNIIQKVLDDPNCAFDDEEGPSAYFKIEGPECDIGLLSERLVNYAIQRLWHIDHEFDVECDDSDLDKDWGLLMLVCQFAEYIGDYEILRPLRESFNAVTHPYYPREEKLGYSIDDYNLPSITLDKYLKES